MGGIGPTRGSQQWFGAFDRSAAMVTEACAGARGADLVDGMVGMNLSAIGVRAGVAVIRSQDEMLGTILDMLA